MHVPAGTSLYKSHPHPDGVHRIKNASNKLTAARKEMGTAHNRLDDFLSRGVVPDDLKEGSSSGIRQVYALDGGMNAWLLTRMRPPYGAPAYIHYRRRGRYINM